MTGPDDDTLRDVVRQAYAVEHEPSGIDVAAGLRDLVRRGRVLPAGQREWFVALALVEPWLTGADAPWPPSNRGIYEQILAWRGHAWNLERSQRVDDVLRAIARMVFDPRDDPFQPSARVQAPRVALARRLVALGLVTARDLDRVEHGPAER